MTRRIITQESLGQHWSHKSTEDTSVVCQPIQGVGVLRYPDDPEAAQYAHHIACSIRQGSVLALPNNRDSHGDYEWDFHIEGGDPGQVQVQRIQNPLPSP